MRRWVRIWRMAIHEMICGGLVREWDHEGVRCWKCGWRP